WAFQKRAISEFSVERYLVDLLGHATALLSGTHHARRARCEKENGNCGTQLTGDAIATAWSALRRLKLPVEKVSIVECFGPTVATPSRLIRSSDTALRSSQRAHHGLYNQKRINYLTDERN
ncbi:unnamed protein product, partial [Nesidiocoris tenuis]